jgi:Ran GTPase-activating protein (RanGAP) involved in mRNA processing and transport
MTRKAEKSKPNESSEALEERLIIDDSFAGAHAEAAGSSKSSPTLVMCSKKITDVGVTALVKALEHNTTVTEVFFSGTANVGIDGWASFTEALATNASVETLYICQTLSDDGAVLLFQALKRNVTVTALLLVNNQVGKEGAAMLAEALECNKTLASIDFLHSTIDDEAATALLRVLKERNTSLKRIGLHPTRSTWRTTEAIRNVVWANAAGMRLLHVQGELDLTSKMWHWDLVKVLSEELATNTSVTALNLRSNGIIDEGAVLISEALGKNRALLKIGLSSNSIGDSGALALAAALRENTTLQGLDLTYNDITDHGVASLAASLKINKSLTKLALRNNRFGNDGIVDLLEALERDNYTLLILDLEGNPKSSPTLLETTDHKIASRRLLPFLINTSSTPLDERMIPHAILIMHQGSLYYKEPEVAHCAKATGNAGSIYYLIRAMASKSLSTLAESL